jgi:hypothetical protein
VGCRYGKADFITLHTPLTKDTKHLIDAESLKKCKPGACVALAAVGNTPTQPGRVMPSHKAPRSMSCREHRASTNL